MKSCKGSYYIIVLEDISKGRIIGSGTLAVEMKYIHKAALVGLNAVVFHDKSFTNDCYTRSQRLFVRFEPSCLFSIYLTLGLFVYKKISKIDKYLHSNCFLSSILIYY